MADKLGKNSIVYDEYTFESGNRTIDEIYRGIDASGVLVYFISDEALNSEWVQREIDTAEEYIKEGKLKRFVPIIIDNNITYKDERIPLWIKENYNLRYISRPNKAYDLIRQVLREVSWGLVPRNKELEQIFIGRTEQIKTFEERIYDYDRSKPNSIIVSGLPEIGRRKFLKHVLKNANIIRDYYQPPIISLDSRSSIEDFIIKLYGLGYSELTDDDISELMDKSIKTKIDLAASLIKELIKNNDILFVIDNFSIVKSDIVDWFVRLNQELNACEENTITLCIVSRSRVFKKHIYEKDSIFSIDMPELEIYERKALFESLLKIYDIQKLSRDDFKMISDLFSGFPEQIKYTIKLLQDEGINYIKNNTHEIVDYNTEKVKRLLTSHQDNPLTLQILKLLSESEIFSFDVLEVVLGNDFEEAQRIILQLANEFIIEFVGYTKEYIRLNDGIRDFIQRLGVRLEKKYTTNLRNHIKVALEDVELYSTDISDYFLSLKEALKNNIDIPDKFLIPSHYINAMRELYNYDTRYDLVISLGQKVLQNEHKMDKRAVHEIRYWLCLALARKKDRRFLEEVQKVKGADHNFLLGFYYRFMNRFQDAITQFEKVLDAKPHFYRAKRELVQVYINIEEYGLALKLAKDSYLHDKNNPYNAQSYFRCLIRTENPDKKELQKILNDMQISQHEKADEMYRTATAQYTATIDNNIQKSLQLIDETIQLYPNKIYPYLTKLDIAKRISNDKVIETINEIEGKWNDPNADIYNKLPYLKSKIHVLGLEDKIEEARVLFEEKVKTNFSEKTIATVEREVRT